MGTTVVVATLKTPFNTNVVFGFESSDEDEPPGKLAFFCYTHTPFHLFIFLVLTLVLIACSGNAHVPSVSCIVPVIPSRTSAHPNGNIPVFYLIFPHPDACFDFVQEVFLLPSQQLPPFLTRPLYLQLKAARMTPTWKWSQKWRSTHTAQKENLV